MNAQTIMICSGKGGTGKTSITGGVGACLALLDQNVLCIDNGGSWYSDMGDIYGRPSGRGSECCSLSWIPDCAVWT